MNRKPSSNSFYFPGMISTLLLPLLCFYHLFSSNAFKVYRSINLFVWDGNESAKNYTIGTHKFITSKTYEIIDFTGDKNDGIKLQDARKKIKSLISSEDTIHGIKFHFEKKSTYKTFVETLNILNEEKAKVWIPYKNDIYVVNPKKRRTESIQKKITYFICRSTYMDNTLPEKEFKIDWHKLLDTLKKFFLPLVLFSFMLYFSSKKSTFKRKA